jgi:hypothetical protein
MVPDLDAFVEYLRGVGRVLEDDDGRTSLWRPQHVGAEADTRIVLPARQEVRDYGE